MDGQGSRRVVVVVEGESDLGPVGGPLSDHRRRGGVRAAREGGSQCSHDECDRKDGPDRPTPPSYVAGREPIRWKVCLKTHVV